MVEVMTDKATVEIPAPRAGKILKLNAKEGETVKVGSVLVIIEELGEAKPEPKRPLLQPLPDTERGVVRTPSAAPPSQRGAEG
jgi:pyruvate/2-oxoglutarate dehydrogenase complex dihydrolipoamide acyltransferase (E2) component